MRRILLYALYVLPILFFVVIYFLQVTSSEDIFQGAGQAFRPVQDAIDAFHWSARLGDMYAWSIINLYDYTYRGGIDTIPRLLDVAMVTGICLLIVAHIVAGRPRMTAKHALLYTCAWLAIVLSPFSRSLLSSWSHIHNYVPMLLLTLAYTLPYTLALRGRELRQTTPRIIGMLVLGYLFGFSANVPPAAFITTLIIMVCILRVRPHLMSWQVAGIGGVLLAMVMMYIYGPGVSSYTHGYADSYATLAQPLKLMANMVKNMQLMMPEMLLMTFALLVEYALEKRISYRRRRQLSTRIRYSLAICIFFVLHVLAVSQIDASTLTRILIPAYVSVVISVLYTVSHLIELSQISRRVWTPMAIILVVIASIVTVDIGIGMYRHRQQAAMTLNRIRTAPQRIVCVSTTDNPTAKSPLLRYYQRELFASWTVPAIIYDHDVVWCENAT